MLQGTTKKAVVSTERFLSRSRNIWNPIKQTRGKIASNLCQNVAVALFDGLLSCSVLPITLSSMHNV